jgi:hypothetical protein
MAARGLGAHLGVKPRYVHGFARSAIKRVAHVFERLDRTALRDGFLREVLLGGIFEPDPRMAQDLPAQLVAVAPVGGVGEEPFLQVGAQHFEEVALRRDPKVGNYALFQLGYQGVLLLGSAIGEGGAAAPTGGEIQRCKAEPVGVSLVLVSTP